MNKIKIKIKIKNYKTLAFGFLLNGALAVTAYAAGDDPNENFVQSAGSGGLAEVELSQLALTNGASVDVKHFAQQMIDAHRANNKELSTIAKSMDLEVPTALDASHESLKATLEKKQGSDFDQAYVAAMRDDHEKMVTLLQQDTKLLDKKLKAFANKTLPVVKHHLQMAQSLKVS